jgi:hypothetical protein
VGTVNDPLNPWPSDLPGVIYKYREWCTYHKETVDGEERVVATPNNLHQNVLRKGDIFFSSAGEFNDPFDPVLSQDRDLLTAEELREHKIFSLKVACPNQPEHWYIEQVDLAPEDAGSGARGRQLALEAIYRNLGVFSASATRESILMWSHYANSHRGFCVGLNTIQVAQSLELMARNREQESRLQPLGRRVSYGKAYPRFAPEHPSMDSFWWQHIEDLSTKADDWSYEEEVRLILLGHELLINDRIHTLTPEAVVEVCLGWKMPEQERQEVLAVAEEKFPQAKIYQARQKEWHFGLEFDRVR